MRIANPAIAMVNKYIVEMKGTHLKLLDDSPRMQLAEDSVRALGVDPTTLSPEAKKAILHTHHK